jgi:hypothetical protein
VDVVPYAPNTLVFFINTRDAFHAVTPRTGTHLPRRFVNIVAQENYVYTDPPPKKVRGGGLALALTSVLALHWRR